MTSDEESSKTAQSGDADSMAAIVHEFLVESYENLDQLDSDLVELEQNPAEQSLLGSIFRTIHTIKGTCGFFGYGKLEAIAHVGENLLSRLRDGDLTLTPEIATALLAMVDAVRQILNRIETTQAEGEEEYPELLETLARLQNASPDAVAVPKAPAASGDSASADVRKGAAVKEGAKEVSLFERLGGEGAIDQVVESFYGRVLSDARVSRFFEGVDARRLAAKQKQFMAFALGGSETYRGRNLTEAHEALVKAGLDDSHFDAVAENLLATLMEFNVPAGLIREVAERVEGTRDVVLGRVSAPPAPAPEASKKPAPAAGKKPAPAAQVDPGGERRQDRAVSEASIRVDVDILDRLMNLVGELVLARNQILQFGMADGDSVFQATTHHLNLVTTELQEEVMKTRMQPIGNVWGKLPRVIRDLAQACGKKVRLEMEGKETELDKTLIEAIKDPLTHIVRNSVDHGLESPEARLAAGKPEEGLLLLRAYHEGGQVNIEIIDDGAGIDPEKIRQKALDKNLITQEQATRMSEREILQLIFAPGFSTAAKVTNVSGRGVGMDVVKTNIEKIGGLVDLQSKVGRGTVMKLKIPLTLAIIPALTVWSGGDRYAIPQVNLLELLRLEGEQARSQVEWVQGTPVYRLRGNLLPLVTLHEKLQVDAAKQDEAVNIVVLKADGRQFGLIVEEISDTEEIVVKPLGRHLSGLSVYAGTTIMGDGKVALILDVIGLAQSARMATNARGHEVSEAARAAEADALKETLLIFSAGGSRRLAIALSEVARLEEFRRDKVESSGFGEVVQYRGEIMPLFHLSHLLGGHGEPADGETLPAIVFSRNGRSVALVVNRIIDIVDETVKRHSRGASGQFAGTVVIQDQVTDILDVENLLGTALSGVEGAESWA